MEGSLNTPKSFIRDTSIGCRFQPNKNFNQGRNFDNHDDLDRNLGSTKLKILTFQGKNDLRACLDWIKMRFVFDCHRYLEERKVKLVVVEFTNYTIIL